MVSSFPILPPSNRDGGEGEDELTRGAKTDSMKAPASLADRNAAIEKKEMHFMALALHASCK